jgi:hypothetical protein
MAKIKIEREDKLDLVIGGKVFIKGVFYRITNGENTNHAYHLDRIFKHDDNWVLKLGDIIFDVEVRFTDLEEVQIEDYRKCDCSFLCEGYIPKNFTWNSPRKN